MRINEIFTSVSGEVGAWPQGTLCCFVRFQGCNLDCSYCDTVKSQNQNEGRSIILETVVDRILKTESPFVLITGGEPFLQETELLRLIEALNEKGIENIAIETNGTYYTKRVSEDVVIIADYKLHLSDNNYFQKFSQYEAGNWIKFMIRDRKDYLSAKQIKEKMFDKYHSEDPDWWNFGKPNFAISAITSKKMNSKILAEWLIKDKDFDWVLNTQIHKQIGIQ